MKESCSFFFFFLHIRKDYECNRLTSGILQLSANTHLVIDETGLTSGQVSQAGRQNYDAIMNLITFQKVPYDFKFYTVEYDTDIPVLILSEAKSFIPVRNISFFHEVEIFSNKINLIYN